MSRLKRGVNFNMNIKQIYIEHYGQLNQSQYDFTDQTLQVIYGFNEAGKSTLFHFIETMLFGFSRKKAEVDRYAPSSLASYGGYCIIELPLLPSSPTIKITRYYKQQKGQPSIAVLEQHDGQYSVLNEQYFAQDEFERMYLSGLNRTIFRDLCALTLDELQATSMQDDAQLNQHLYHATWESSKLISQLEKKSEEAMNALYRPRGSKQEINIIMNELSQVKSELQLLENELESYEAIQAKMKQLEVEYVEVSRELEAQLLERAVLEKVEQDYPLYVQVKQLRYEQQHIDAHRLTSQPLLQEVTLFMQAREQKQGLIEDLQHSQQQLQLERDTLALTINETLLEQQKKIVSQSQFIEQLMEDVDVRKQQLEKHSYFIKQKSYVGSEYLAQDQILNQQFKTDDLAKVTDMEEQEKLHKQKIALLEHQSIELEKKLKYVKEQHEWLTQSLAQLMDKHRHSETPYTFVPQNIDDLLRAEASYDESYKRLIQENNQQLHNKGTPSRTKNKEGNQHVSKLLLMTYAMAIVCITVLLLTQFNWVNLGLSMLVLASVAILHWSQLRSTATKLQLSSSERDEVKEFLIHLSRLILSRDPFSAPMSWTMQDDLQLKQHIQTYKSLLKEIEQTKTASLANEKEQFDLQFQLNQTNEQLIQEQAKVETLYSEWCSYLNEKQLPLSATFSEIKVFIQELRSIKDAIQTEQAMTERLAKDEATIAQYINEYRQLVQLMNLPSDEYELHIVQMIKVDYYTHEENAKHYHHIMIQLEHLKNQIDQLQDPLIVEEQRIRTMFAEANQSSLEQWQAWIAWEDKWMSITTMLHKLEQERRTILSSERVKDINEKYEQFSFDELVNLAVKQFEYVEQLKVKQLSMLEERGQLQERLASLSNMTDRQQLEQQQSVLEAKLQEVLKRYATYAIIEYAVSTTRTQFEAEHQPALLQQASQYLNKLTDGKYIKIVLQPDTQNFVLATDKLTMMPIERLSRGTAELVYFCLRVALLSTHQSLKKAPLILDDPFVNLDEHRLQQVLNFVYELAKVRQVILLTCHAHILNQMYNHKEIACIALNKENSIVV